MTTSFKSQWNKIKGETKIQWSKLTDDDLLRIEGEKDKLVAKLQERYQCSKEDTHQQYHDFLVRHNLTDDDRK